MTNSLRVLISGSLLMSLFIHGCTCSRHERPTTDLPPPASAPPEPQPTEVGVPPSEDGNLDQGDMDGDQGQDQDADSDDGPKEDRD